jgi:hypothetical protein
MLNGSLERKIGKEGRKRMRGGEGGKKVQCVLGEIEVIKNRTRNERQRNSKD